MRRLGVNAKIAGIATVCFSGALHGESADPSVSAVMAVCGRCHGASVITAEPRSWQRWNSVFYEMTRLGATGTVEQLQAVTSYFLDNLTTVNVNTGTAEELSWVLGASDEVAQEIIERRERARFDDLATLRTVRGLNAERLERLRTRIEF